MQFASVCICPGLIVVLVGCDFDDRREGVHGNFFDVAPLQPTPSLIIAPQPRS